MTPRDNHEDAFFQAGNEGTYDGGPSSLLPVKLEDWAEPAKNLPTPEQIERRLRLRRMVVGIVSSLSALVLVGASFRFAFGREGAWSSPAAAAAPHTVDPAVATAIGRGTPSPAVVEPAAPNAIAPSTPEPATAASGDVVQGPEPSLAATEADAPTAPAAAVPTSPAKNGRADSSGRASTGASARTRRTDRAVGAASFPQVHSARASNDARSVQATHAKSNIAVATGTARGHEPPTATFPN